MAEAAPVAAPVAPSPTAQPSPAVAPSGQATPQPGATAPKTHHSATQPRTEVGTFDRKPEPPSFVEIDGKRIPMEQARAIFAERQEDERAGRAEREELQRLRQEAQRWQRPEAVLTPEQRRQIALQELKEFERQQEEAKLPPEQQAFLRQRREFERQQAEFQRQREEAAQQAQHAANVQQREQAANNVQAALKALGTTDADSLALRLVVDEFWMASERGKQYPPEVIARRVQRQLDTIASQRAAKLGPKALLGNAEFVAALNALDDEEALKVLGPLGERLRARNLQSRGLTQPATPQQPSNVVPLPTGQQPRTDAEWIQHFRANGSPDPSNGAAHSKYWALRDRGVL